MTEEQQAIQGGIVIEDATEEQALNSGSNRNKISPTKLLILTSLALIVVAGGLFGGLTYIRSQLNFGSDKHQSVKSQLSYSTPPESIGRYAPPPLLEEPIEDNAPLPETEVETEVVEETTPDLPVLIAEPVEQVPYQEQSNEPTLSDRRLAASIQSYNTVNNTTEESVPSRQVKLLKNIDYTLIKGTKIPCTMETNIVSEQDGFTSCIINQDVYSGNARVLLIEKGTKVTGEYHGDVKNGDRRLQIIWDRLITPYDIVVQLDSPSTDRLGASGVTGKVDNRWRLRIGSALLVSMMGDALNILGEREQSAEVIVDSNTADTSQDLAKEILKNNINLSPIVYIREGEMINIYVADDIDLSEVYNVQTW